MPAPADQPKKTRLTATTAYYDINPSWRVNRIELAGPFGWQTLDANQLEKIRERLHGFESMRWREILVDARKQNHLIPLGELSKEAVARLDERFAGRLDVDELLSLRVQARERIWGILDRGVCELLWWDPYHQVCPSLLRNT